jgi:uncharacterized protein
MNKLHVQFTQLRKKYGVSWQLIEQDYLLSWMLAGIAGTPELERILIFKGGTALKKSYFGEYRFSQDLDFSISEALPQDTILEELVRTACQYGMQLQAVYGYPLKITCEKYTENEPHPHDQKAFSIIGQFPWHREPLTRVMHEITPQELILLSPVERPILHQEYNEVLDGILKVYRLEEVVSEKIRAILQYAAKLHERGWARSRARDYYYLWSILTTYKQFLNLSLIPNMVVQKCLAKDVRFSGPSDLFSPELLKDLERAWKRWLTPYVPFLPKKTKVLNELRHELDLIWGLPPRI